MKFDKDGDAHKEMRSGENKRLFKVKVGLAFVLVIIKLS